MALVGTPIIKGRPRSLAFFSDEERALAAVGRGSACGATEGSSKGLAGPRGAEAEAARARCAAVPPRQHSPVPAELTDSNPGLPQQLPVSRTKGAEGPGSAAGAPPALARLPQAGAPLPAAVPPRGGGSGRLRPHLWRSGGGSARGRRRRVGARRHHDGGCAAGHQGEGQILPPRGRRRPGLHPARRGGGRGGGGRGQRGDPAVGGAAGGGGGRRVQEGALRRPAGLLRAAAPAAGSRQAALREAPEEVRKGEDTARPGRPERGPSAWGPPAQGLRYRQFHGTLGMPLIPQAFQSQRPAPRWGQGLLRTCSGRSRCCWGGGGRTPTVAWIKEHKICLFEVKMTLS